MNRPYQWLARYYDELFLPVRHPIDVAREHVLRRIWPRIQSACDLACGTGTTALLLARRGILTYAVDRSSQMCRLTRDKARKNDLSVRVIQGDMRNFRLPEAVDLVTCEYDAVNHVPHKSDLRRVAGAVRRALHPGGYFFFDVNNSRAFRQYWSGTVWVDRPDVALVMRNGREPECDRAWCEIELFTREGTLWRRHHEKVQEVCWSSGEIKKVLQDAGFDQARTWDAASFWKNPQIGRGCRTIYLAHKSEQ